MLQLCVIHRASTVCTRTPTTDAHTHRSAPPPLALPPVGFVPRRLSFQNKALHFHAKETRWRGVIGWQLCKLPVASKQRKECHHHRHHHLPMLAHFSIPSLGTANQRSASYIYIYFLRADSPSLPANHTCYYIMTSRYSVAQPVQETPSSERR